jgi:hypothetical protein
VEKTINLSRAKEILEGVRGKSQSIQSSL